MTKINPKQNCPVCNRRKWTYIEKQNLYLCEKCHRISTIEEILNEKNDERKNLR